MGFVPAEPGPTRCKLPGVSSCSSCGSPQAEGARFCEVWTMRGHEIEKLVNYQDVSTWLRQLGLVPEPEPRGL